MAKTQENGLYFQPTERRQFQFDALDKAIARLNDPNLTREERVIVERDINSLKITIALQGPDVGEFRPANSPIT